MAIAAVLIFIDHVMRLPSCVVQPTLHSLVGAPLLASSLAQATWSLSTAWYMAVKPCCAQGQAHTISDWWMGLAAVKPSTSPVYVLAIPQQGLPSIKNRRQH